MSRRRSEAAGAWKRDDPDYFLLQGPVTAIDVDVTGDHLLAEAPVIRRKGPQGVCRARFAPVRRLGTGSSLRPSDRSRILPACGRFRFRRRCNAWLSGHRASMRAPTPRSARDVGALCGHGVGDGVDLVTELSQDVIHRDDAVWPPHVIRDRQAANTALLHDRLRATRHPAFSGTVATSRVITVSTAASGDRPTRTPRVTMSRSVTIPVT